MFLSRKTPSPAIAAAIFDFSSPGSRGQKSKKAAAIAGLGVFRDKNTVYRLQAGYKVLKARLKVLTCSRFQSFVSDPVKRDPILDQFSMFNRPYTRVRPKSLKTIPFPAAHTRIANI